MTGHNLTGDRYGSIRVIEYVGVNPQRYGLWRTVCDCGKETIASRCQIVGGSVCMCQNRAEPALGAALRNFTAPTRLGGR